MTASRIGHAKKKTFVNRVLLNALKSSDYLETFKCKDCTTMDQRNASVNQHESIIELSSEDKLFLQKVRRDAALLRGYPLALISAGLVLIGIPRAYPKMEYWKKMCLVAGAGMVGNIAGRFSYLPTMVARMETELPYDSVLRQNLRKRRGADDQASENRPLPDQGVQFGLEEDAPGKDAAAPKRFVSYSDLRRQTQQNQAPRLPPSPPPEASPPAAEREIPASYLGQPGERSLGARDQDQAFLSPPQEFEAPRRANVRYNKYGDEIVA